MEGSGDQAPRRERLEVPSSSQLERRLLVNDQPQRRRSKPSIKALPQSSLLGRLQDFLPALQAANANLQQQLETQPQSEVAMERGSDDEREGPYVEMALACGIFDLKDPAAVAAAERSLINQGVAIEKYGGSSGSDSDSDSDASSSSEDEEELQDAEGQPEAAAAADGEGGGGDAMLHDGAAADAGQQPGRRIKGKQRSKRHAGIEELS